MGQTCSMARYVGKMYGLHPTDPFEQWINDAWMEDYNEGFSGVLNMVFMDTMTGKSQAAI